MTIHGSRPSASQPTSLAPTARQHQAPERAPTPSQSDLPEAVLYTIFSRLEDARDLGRCGSVNKAWQKGVANPRLWHAMAKTMYLRDCPLRAYRTAVAGACVSGHDLALAKAKEYASKFPARYDLPETSPVRSIVWAGGKVLVQPAEQIGVQTCQSYTVRGRKAADPGYEAALAYGLLGTPEWNYKLSELPAPVYQACADLLGWKE